jgi:hypothetical protein
MEKAKQKALKRLPRKSEDSGQWHGPKPVSEWSISLAREKAIHQIQKHSAPYL